MEWLAAALIVTGLWVWFWAAVCFFIVLALAENEKNFWAVVTVSLFVGLLHHSNQLPTAFFEPMSLVGWLVVYFVVGSVWSFIKWFSFINKRAEKFGEVKLSFIKKHNQLHENSITQPEDGSHPMELLEVDIKTKIPQDLIPDFNRHLLENYYPRDYHRGNYDNHSLDGIIPSAGYYKEKIVTWILWWPTSAFWTILNDPLVRFANWIYSRLQEIYKKMANRVFAKFEI